VRSYGVNDASDFKPLRIMSIVISSMVWLFLTAYKFFGRRLRSLLMQKRTIYVQNADPVGAIGGARSGNYNRATCKSQIFWRKPLCKSFLIVRRNIVVPGLITRQRFSRVEL
jgi:hypothetical protein